MFSFYKTHYNPLYNKLVELSRNIFFYEKLTLKDNFETRINLIFVHFSLILIVFKKKEIEFPQEIFDNIFMNIEYHIRELGYGDVAVNKKMKTLTRILYDILLKINKKDQNKFLINKSVLKTYFHTETEDNKQIIDDIELYFINFFHYCFELGNVNMLKGRINFKYKVANGSS